MRLRRLVWVLGLPLLGLACSKEEPPPPVTAAKPEPPPAPKVDLPPAPPLAPTPVGLPELVVPTDNPMTPEKVALGKKLFFDKRLSKDGTASCQTCHLQEKGWTDGQPLSTKVGGAVNSRHTPTLYNVGYLTAWYWDGRSPTLEKQIEAAWKGQMGADFAAVTAALAKDPTYAAEFKRAFDTGPTQANVPQALASYVRTLRSGGSAWDRYEKGDKAAVPPDAVAGWELFRGKAQCTLCHAPPNFTDSLFHNVGIGMDKPEPDPGHGTVSKKPEDTGTFKTPGLRSVTKSGPYFHDGSVASLEEAVKYMAGGGKKNPHLDAKLKPVKLSPKELGQLMAFLKALESEEPAEKP